MSRNAHFDAGSGAPRPVLKSKYYVDELGMVPPPSHRGFGQVDPVVLEKLRGQPSHYDALPLTDVSLRAPVRASQATVHKSKVDRIPKTANDPRYGYSPPKAAPFEGGVHLFDGHHRTGYAMKHDHESIPMALFDPDNPQHVEHMAEVHRRIQAIHEPLTEHRFAVIREHGFFGKATTREGEAARAAFMTRQTEDTARIERIKTEARVRWLG